MNRLPAAAILGALLALAGCSVKMTDSFHNAINVTVVEVGRADNCGVAAGQSRLTLLPDLDAVDVWLGQHPVKFFNRDRFALQPTSYTVIEYDGAARFVISRSAILRKDRVLILNATFLPVPADAAQSSSGTCALVALPPTAKFDKLLLRDQSGATRARGRRGSADAPPPSPSPELTQPEPPPPQAPSTLPSPSPEASPPAAAPPPPVPEPAPTTPSSTGDAPPPPAAPAPPSASDSPSAAPDSSAPEAPQLPPSE